MANTYNTETGTQDMTVEQIVQEAKNAQSGFNPFNYIFVGIIGYAIYKKVAGIGKRWYCIECGQHVMPSKFQNTVENNRASVFFPTMGLFRSRNLCPMCGNKVIKA